MSIKKHLFIFVLSLLAIITLFSSANTAQASAFSFIILSDYQAELDIGTTINLYAITSNLKKPTWSSSDSKIASVDTYGKVTAKKAGTVTIRAKTKDASASCKITVHKTEIILSNKTLSVENGTKVKLTASTSNGSKVKWKSSKSSIAAILEDGQVTAKKVGETTITATADGTSVTCQFTVKKPSVTLSKSKITLYRNAVYQLSASISSNIKPKWKSNRNSVATVNDTGRITAVKHGTAIISVTVDGVVKTCEVTVTQPEITLNQTEISVKKGTTYPLLAKVSSGNTPAWSSSNTRIVTVNTNGVITAQELGKAYVYASEDGVKTRCIVKVTE